MKDGLPPNSTENKSKITPKRQKILDDAFLEMRKAQKTMNPKFLAKIRNLVKNSPVMIEKLGLKKSEIPRNEPKLAPKVKEPVKEAPKQQNYEKIDQSKNIDIVSKLMEISPEKKDKIVEMLSKK